MKAKHINAVICKKFDDFLSSIDEPKIKELVSENTLITGGCIASMLLKEEVNDYDLYFTNKETAHQVALYYVAKFNAAHPDKKGQVIEEEDRIKIFFQSDGVASDDEYSDDKPKETLQAVSTNEITDFEEFKKSENSEKQKPQYRPVYISSNAITLSNQIQIVIRFYGNPEEIHENYDYVHCTNYWLSKTRSIHLNQKALESLLAKELVYVGSKYPIASIIRSRKFINRGWSINAGQYLKMAYQVSKLNLDDLNVLEDQLIGVDTAYFNMLIKALREKEKSVKEKNKNAENEEFEDFLVNYGYLVTLIDKMF